MKENHFDKYADEYDNILREHVSFFEEESDYFAAYKVHCMRDAVKANPERILEYGCGTGRNLKFLREQFPNAKIFGCDVSEKSLSIAAKENTQVTFFYPDKVLSDDKYDLIFISCVFHHIPQDRHVSVLEEINRLLDSHGEVFIFEHNPYNPVTVNVVKRCPLDIDAVLIKPRQLKSALVMSKFVVMRTSYTLFFPSFLKKLRPMEKYMRLLPLGGQYYIQAIKDFGLLA